MPATSIPTSYDYSRPHIWNCLNGKVDQGYFRRQVAAGIRTRLEYRLICQERGWVA